MTDARSYELSSVIGHCYNLRILSECEQQRGEEQRSSKFLIDLDLRIGHSHSSYYASTITFASIVFRP